MTVNSKTVVPIEQGAVNGARVIHLDCPSGLSGDMFLGACLDAGLPRAVLDEIPHRLGLDQVSLSIVAATRGGLAGVRFEVLEAGGEIQGSTSALDGVAHHHSSGHGIEPRHDDHVEHDDPDEENSQRVPASDHRLGIDTRRTQHRGLTEIRRRIHRSGLNATVRERAEEMFVRLAEVEARMHMVPLEDVHFHELGAIDSMIDIVGAAAAMHYFAPSQVTCGVVVTGDGTVQTAHGLLPVPAPATAELLIGVPVSSRGGHSLRDSQTDSSAGIAAPLGELLTPTGALILDSYVGRYARNVDMRATSYGSGLGRRELSDRPNAVRLTLGEATNRYASCTDQVIVLETTVDDASGERIAAAIAALLAGGALDAYATSVMMKKGRPGFLVTALAQPADTERLAASLLRETGSLGCRQRMIGRFIAQRKVVPTETPWGSVPVKIGWLGSEIISVAPESDACQAIALGNGVSWSEVYRVALNSAKRRISGEIE